MTPNSSESTDSRKSTTAVACVLIVLTLGISAIGCGGGDPVTYNRAGDNAGDANGASDTAASLGAPTSSNDGAMSAEEIAETQDRLKRVGIGIHMYHSKHRRMPQAFIAGSDGKPKYSWRVELLPFIKEDLLWNRWNKEESWDGPTNGELLFNTPNMYRSAKWQGIREHDGDCHLFGIRDANSMMGDGSKAVKFRDVLDGLANTLMVVHLPGRTVPWTSPQDLTADEVFSEVSTASTARPVFMLFADGGVYTVTKPLDRSLFDAIVTRAGSEVIDPSAFR